MHELSLAMNMVEQLEGVMKRENASRLIKISVEIGALSGVEREPMEFCFPMASKGTILEGAEFHVEEVPLKVTCRECHESTYPDFPGLYCVACGDCGVDIVAGRDFKIKTIEVE